MRMLRLMLVVMVLMVMAMVLAVLVCMPVRMPPVGIGGKIRVISHFGAQAHMNLHALNTAAFF